MKASCDFCYRHCRIEEGGYGYCMARKNEGGRVTDRAYGRVNALAADPIEKKPLYHFLPGTRTLSLSMAGCSFDCDFCQNHAIAKDDMESGRTIMPSEIAAMARECGIPSVSFTYTEPLVWQDYAIETARIARSMGIHTVMVSNGSFSEEALERLLPLIDAYNIDLKGDAEFYRSIVHGDIRPVLDGIGRIVSYGSHIEVTTMAIEGIHTPEMMLSLRDELIRLGVSVWHITAFYPRRRMSSRRPSSDSFIYSLADMLSGSGIEHVHAGNVGPRAT